MRAAPEDQLRLLDLQRLDTTVGRLTHRRLTLPELAEIEALRDRARTLADDVVMAETHDSDLGRDQAKVDTDVEQVRSRMQRDQQRLDAGQVGSPKELENLQHEIASLHRRQSDLEDAELEVMEQRETVQARLGVLRVELNELTASHAAAEERLTATTTEIDHELSTVGQHRDQIARSLPDDLRALYEKLRASAGGVGAAALHRGRCEGCHLALNTTDLNRLRAADADEVARCEECRRILVRTAESGL